MGSHFLSCSAPKLSQSRPSQAGLKAKQPSMLTKPGIGIFCMSAFLPSVSTMKNAIQTARRARTKPRAFSRVFAAPKSARTTISASATLALMPQKWLGGKIIAASAIANSTLWGRTRHWNIRFRVTGRGIGSVVRDQLLTDNAHNFTRAFIIEGNKRNDHNNSDHSAEP